MANKVRNRVSQAVHGSTELARAVRSFHGLMVHIARVAGVSRPHVSLVLAGPGRSKRVLRIALRELAKAEAGKFRRAT